MIQPSMRAISCESPGLFKELSEPVPDTIYGHSLVQIKRVGVCGTDIHAFAGNQPFFSYPRILGHELAAKYVTGYAESFSEGDPLTIIPYFHCGKCRACSRGLTNCCRSMQVFGVHVDGGMRDFALVPDECLIHGEGLSLDELAMVEPHAISLHGVRRAQVTDKDIVLVMGTGPIGLNIIRFAKLTGASVIALDIDNHRLRVAHEIFGADKVINPGNGQVLDLLARITGDEMVDVIIDATGNRQVMNTAFEYLGHGGRYVLVGLQKEDITFSQPEFHKRESTLMSSRNATREDFQYVMNEMRSGKINVDQLITHRLKFNDVTHKFNELGKKKNRVIKAIIDLD